MRFLPLVICPIQTIIPISYRKGYALEKQHLILGRFAVFSRLLVQIGRYQGSAPSSSTQTNDAVELFVEFLEWFHPLFSLKLSDRSKTEARKLLATLESLIQIIA